MQPATYKPISTRQLLSFAPFSPLLDLSYTASSSENALPSRYSTVNLNQAGALSKDISDAIRGAAYGLL
jgi:hypothetical protein